MANNSNRRLNPRPGGVIALCLFIGLIASAGAIYGWAHLALTTFQRKCLPLYCFSSLPLVKTVPHNMVRSVFGEAVNPKDKSRVGVMPIRQTLFAATYRRKPVTKVLLVPAEITAGLLFASLLAGCVAAANQRQKMENGIQLRGPKRLSIKQFNKHTKGDGFTLYVED